MTPQEGVLLLQQAADHLQFVLGDPAPIVVQFGGLTKRIEIEGANVVKGLHDLDVDGDSAS
jgi:hypothetical protein